MTETPATDLPADDTTESVVAQLSRPRREGRVVKVVRGIGWTFIYVGFLILGFVFHQLFITDFFAERAQAGLEKELEARLATTEPRRAILDPETGQIIEVDEAGGNGGTTPSPDLETGPGILFALETAPDEGEPVGIIRIPEIDVDWAVVEGVRLGSDLKKGAGHYPDTPLPGQPGNAAIAGHRTTYGAPFHDLDKLEPGDQIFWDSATGTHVYAVRDIQVVKPTAVWVVEPKDGGWLTLTTCNPKFSARERLVVFAEMVGGPNAPVIVGNI